MVHKKQRKFWARRWATFDFSQTIFSDEKRFAMLPDSSGRVWRFRNERYQSKFLARRTQAQGGGIMVWGALTKTSTLPLILIKGTLTGEGYCSILRQVFPRTTRGRQLLKDYNFQQDNSSVHTCRAAETLLKARGVEILPWPSLSPGIQKL